MVGPLTHEGATLKVLTHIQGKILLPPRPRER